MGVQQFPASAVSSSGSSASSAPRQVFTYNASDGSLATITDYDASNAVTRTVTLAYSSGNVSTATTVVGSKTTTRTYAYDGSGNVTGYQDV